MAGLGTVLILVGGLTIAVGAQAPDMLDLTRVRVSDSTPTTAGSGSGSATGLGSHVVRTAIPLQLTLEWMDKDSYRYGETFTFRLTVRNTSREAVTIPWEPDPSRVLTGPDAPLQRALLTLDVDVAGKRALIPIAMLYGSRMSPGHVKVMNPGSKAEIIANGSWEFQPFTAEHVRGKDFAGDVTVTAKLGFLTGIHGHAYRDLRSVNSLRVALEKRKFP